MQGRRKVFYISDIHCDMKMKKGFKDFSDKEYINHVIKKMNGDDPFGDNPLIIVGDIDCCTENVDYFFSQLRMRRDGIIIFVLGNHEIWAYDMAVSDLDEIIKRYRVICKKHDVIMLQNELAFFYDDRTGNGELLSFSHHHVISENELSELAIDPVLLKYLIMTFSNMEKNKKGAQLIFTSHDLSTMNSEVFRRDEIWFVAKGNRQNSKLYSLVEFKNKKGESVRKDAKFDKQYLEGKYGADPYLRKIIDWGTVNLFSTLIKCKECGWSFRRTVRTYKNTYVRWVCSGRNGRGVDSCPNKTVVDEEELIEVLQEYFTNVLKQKKKVIAHVVNEFQRVYKAKDENVEYEKELNAELAKLQKTRQKYMDMYTDDLISREELNEKIGGSRQEMERIENELKMVSYHLTKGEQLENILNNTFKEIEDITDVHQMTNQQLKRLIQKIEVDKDGNVDIYLRLLGDLGLDESVLIEENETVLNCDDQT